MQGSFLLPKPLVLSVMESLPPPGRIWAWGPDGTCWPAWPSAAARAPGAGRAPGELSEPRHKGLPRQSPGSQTSARASEARAGPELLMPRFEAPSLSPRLHLFSPSFDVVEKCALRLHGKGKQCDLGKKRGLGQRGALGTCRSAPSWCAGLPISSPRKLRLKKAM